MIRTCVTIAAVAVCWGGGTARAQSAATCAYDPATATVTVTVNGQNAYVYASWTGQIRLSTGPCGDATLTNTDTVLVNGGTRADPVFLNGLFAPGLTPETDGTSEIEIVFSLAGGKDTANIDFTQQHDEIVFTSGGIDVGGDGDEDIVLGGSESVLVGGRGGGDVINGSAYTGGPLHLSGGNGNDVITGSAAGDTLFGDDGGDVVRGGPGADTIVGGLGDDDLFGAGGADAFIGDPWIDGSDAMHGGSGRDVASYRDRTQPVDATLGNGLADDGEAGEGDFIDFDVEDLRGGNADDVLVGSSGANVIDGDAGDDQMWGGDGDDVLSGMGGADEMYGEAGDDVLDGNGGPDVLTGGPGMDRLIGSFSNDLIFNADGAADEVDCGGGDADDAEPDPPDTFIDCEL